MSELEFAREMEEGMLREIGWLAPIGALTLAAVVAVVLALVLPRERQGITAAWVAGAHLATAGIAAGVWLDGGFRALMDGTVLVDGLSLAIAGLVGVAGALSVAIARPTIAGTDRESEFYAVLAACSLAAVVLASAGDAALVAIAVGLLSLSSFVMTAYRRRSARGNEAALKYYIYGTVTGATMVYGLSWWFGLAGSTGLEEIGRALPGAPLAAVAVSSALVVVGLGYKAALVPFHFWTPDVYDGAPLPVAAYLSVIPKIAGLVALARVLDEALPGATAGWPVAIAVIAAATMTLGNIAALWQDSLARLLAYSSIAQSGYLLMGVAALDGSDLGLPSLVYYAIAYAVTNLAAFAVVIAVQRERGRTDVAGLSGLWRVHPWWAAALVVSMLSLLGLPPLAGFVGKLEVFAAAIDAGMAWLAVVAVVNTVISLFYYLRVMRPAVLGRPPAGAPDRAAVRLEPLGAAIVITGVLTVAVGIAAEPLLALAESARAL